jgi:hypothetical protein
MSSEKLRGPGLRGERFRRSGEDRLEREIWDARGQFLKKGGELGRDSGLNPGIVECSLKKRTKLFWDQRHEELAVGRHLIHEKRKDELIAIHLELAPLLSGGARKGLNRSVESLTKGVHLGLEIALKCNEVPLFNERQV